MGQAEKPPITVIEPENLETVFITGGHVEAIDTQRNRSHSGLGRQADNQLAQNSSSRGCAVKCGYRNQSWHLQKAIAQVIGELKHDVGESHE